MSADLLWPLGGMAVGVLGVLAVRAYEQWRWWRLARPYSPQPIANTAMPTLTELNRPEWIEEP